MSFVIAVVAGIVPMTIYPIFLYLMDRYEKEPLHLVFGLFLWGFFPAALMSLFSQLILGVPLMMLDETGNLNDLVSTIVFAPITEEVFKGLAILGAFLLLRHEFDSIYDGILYGGLVGFGFAAIENVLYFLDTDIYVILLRTVVFGLNHALFTSLTGIGFGIARHEQRTAVRWLAPVGGLLLAIVMHALHNALVTFSGDFGVLFLLALIADWGGVLFLLLIIVFSIRNERRWIETQLEEEVRFGTLTQAEYQKVSSPSERLILSWSAFRRSGVSGYIELQRYLNKLTHLAYKKHALERKGDSEFLEKRINELRKEAAALSKHLRGAF